MQATINRIGLWTIVDRPWLASIVDRPSSIV